MKRAAHLDALRGVAALAVCAGHLRSHLFRDFAELDRPLPSDVLFYAATGLGHQAVVVFFALSGFFVGGGACNARWGGTWSWRGYAIRRLSRLWLVLGPALLLTWGWDALGALLTRGRGYDGSLYAMLSVGPSAPPVHGLSTLLGNLFFLQTIAVPTYGTNGPLWSLSNEGWYYILFPLLLACVRPRSLSEAVASGALALLGLFLLPSGHLVAGLSWLFGVAAHLLLRQARARAVCAHPLYGAAATAATFASLGLSLRHHWLGSDLVLGACTSLWIAALASWPAPSALYRAAAKAMSEISYTLYLSHYPLLAFLSFAIVGIRQERPGLSSLGFYVAFLALLVAYATGLWWLFERQTPRVQAWLLKWTPRSGRWPCTGADRSEPSRQN